MFQTLLKTSDYSSDTHSGSTLNNRRGSPPEPIRGPPLTNQRPEFLLELRRAANRRQEPSSANHNNGRRSGFPDPDYSPPPMSRRRDRMARRKKREDHPIPPEEGYGGVDLWGNARR